MFCLQKYNTKQWIRTQKEIQYTDVMKQDEGTKFSHIVFWYIFPVRILTADVLLFFSLRTNSKANEWNTLTQKYTITYTILLIFSSCFTLFLVCFYSQLEWIAFLWESTLQKLPKKHKKYCGCPSGNETRIERIKIGNNLYC